MDKLNLLDTAFGVVLPYVAAYINKPTFPAWAKHLVVLGLALAFAVPEAFFTDKFNAQDIVTSVVYIAVLAEVAYRKFYKSVNNVEVFYGNTDKLPGE